VTCPLFRGHKKAPVKWTLDPEQLCLPWGTHGAIARGFCPVSLHQLLGERLLSVPLGAWSSAHLSGAPDLSLNSVACDSPFLGVVIACPI